jgi:8-amino-7-oxononanoate synthase
MPEGLKEYLFNFSSPFIYTTTLPEAHAASAIDLLEIISECNDKRTYLREMSRQMKQGLKREGFRVKGDAHILALEIGDEDRAVDAARGLLKKGIFTLPARFPTVPIRKAILRLSMTALHTEEDVVFFLGALREVFDKVEQSIR